MKPVSHLFKCIIPFIMLISNISYAESNVKGVCAFDIDSTLLCDGAKAAVVACLDAGFELAIDTARGKKAARNEIDRLLLKKGFPEKFVEVARNQVGLAGPFQYHESWNIKQPQEQQFQQKSYGLRQIAKYYNLKLDESDSKKIILFDDLTINIDQVRPTILDPKGPCIKNEQGECYSDPATAPQKATFPRNWKIYQGKWVGFLCMNWRDADKAKRDAEEMIRKVNSIK